MVPTLALPDARWLKGQELRRRRRTLRTPEEPWSGEDVDEWIAPRTQPPEAIGKTLRDSPTAASVPPGRHREKSGPLSRIRCAGSAPASASASCRQAGSTTHVRRFRVLSLTMQGA